MSEKMLRKREDQSLESSQFIKRLAPCLSSVAAQWGRGRQHCPYEQYAAGEALLAAEGPNEMNNFPVTYRGEDDEYAWFLPASSEVPARFVSKSN
jgi:hypothetical protein